MAIRRRLTNEQKGRIAEKLMEWGNLVFVGLVIGQLVPGTGQLRLSLMIAGISIMIVAFIAAYLFMTGGESE